MCKMKILKKLVLLGLFLVNTVTAVLYGTSWLYWVSAVLVLAVLALDIWEALKNGKR